MTEILQFVPFKSFVSPTFWHKLAEEKIDVAKLSDEPRPIFGFYTNVNPKSCLLEFDYSSFNREFIPPKHNFASFGTIYNKNTIEDFKNCKKIEYLDTEGKKFLHDIENGIILDDPRLLSRFFVLSFADLKVHKYYYWFAFPCPLNPVIYTSLEYKPKNIGDYQQLDNIFEHYTSISNPKDQSFFAIIKDGSYCALRDLKEENLEDVFFCYSEPSEYDKPSWLLRIYIVFLMKSFPSVKGKKINFVGIKGNGAKDISKSLVWNIEIPKEEIIQTESMQFVGYEANQNGKMCPRISSMAETMDPAKLSEISVNLNLKLMKWRILPNLNLDIIVKQRCLLFGAGTLGCGVARNLLAWGFKNITLIDSGKVSYSNPVRQSLFVSSDALSGKKMKATCAAERLLEINPSAKTKGYVLQIPMPGHTVGDSLKDDIIQDLNTIEELVKSHDVLFLLTDSRESRWLPTLLGAVHKKIVINAALGFDSYLVMRHGTTKTDETIELKQVEGLKCISGSDLGCYFCNDVTAPGNSLKDRTLDQQCTVTRPGVSNIAASYAVELLVALLQHPQKELAPAYFQQTFNTNTSIPEGILGIIPHSIRGMLCNYENITPAAMKFKECIACSKMIIDEFKGDLVDFLLKVLESSKYLEDVTGISKYEDLDSEIIEFDDSDLE